MWVWLWALIWVYVCGCGVMWVWVWMWVLPWGKNLTWLGLWAESQLLWYPAIPNRTTLAGNVSVILSYHSEKQFLSCYSFCLEKVSFPRQHIFLPTHTHLHSPTLCDLARVCAEVCCACGPQVNSELMGAFRALCLPTTMKSCHTGFTHLTCKTNVWCQDSSFQFLANHNRFSLFLITIQGTSFILLLSCLESVDWNTGLA